MDVASDPDDEALSWEGDDESRRRESRRPSVDRSGTAAGGTDADTPVTSAGDDEPHGLGTASLVLVGVLGGVYLLYTVGWLIGGIRLKQLANLIVADAMYVPWLVLAVAAPALWFLVCWMLTRHHPVWQRMLVLVAGAVLLIPWPFVMMGALGS